MEHAKRPPKKEEMKKRFQIFRPSFSMLIFQGVKNNVMVGWFAAFFDFSLNFCPLTEGTKTALRPSFFSSWVLIMFLKPQHLWRLLSGWNMSINFLNGVAGNLFRNLEMIWHDIKHYEMTWHQMIQKWYEMISNMLKRQDMKCNMKWYEMIPNIMTWSFHSVIWQWSPLQVLMSCHCEDGRGWNPLPEIQEFLIPILLRKHPMTSLCFLWAEKIFSDSPKTCNFQDVDGDGVFCFIMPPRTR